MHWLFIGAALAGEESQTRFDLARGEREWTFTFGWRDAEGEPDSVRFSLPAAALVADREAETWFPRREMYEDVAREVRSWGKDLRGVKLAVRVEEGGLRIDASGTGDVRGALAGAATVRDEAVGRWLEAHTFVLTGAGSVSFDHARLVVDYPDDLAPVARALREGTADDRAFVDRALSFVQSIPYEARKQKGGDPGYRRPLALLSRDRGDCDSKAVLFLAIVRAELPDVPLAVVYVPGHALAGVGLDRRRGDDRFKHEGVRYLYAEPVGPAQHPLGEPGEGNERAGKTGEIHPVPR